MVQEELLRMLGAVLVSAGGEVPLDHVESLLREKFDVELQNVTKNHVTLEKYLLTNFSDICRVKRATDGHFVVRMLQLPSISHLLPAGYVEPEFEPLTTTELQSAPNHAVNGAPGPKPSGDLDSQPNGVPGSEAKRASASQANGIARPQVNGVKRPLANGVARPQMNGVASPWANCNAQPQANVVARPHPNDVARPHPAAGGLSSTPNGAQILIRRAALSSQTKGATGPQPGAASILQENRVPAPKPKSVGDPQSNKVQSPQLNKVSGAGFINVQKQSDQNVISHAAAIKASSEAAPRPRFDAKFAKDCYQDDVDAATILANLENQLSEECSVRGIIEPSFKTTTWGEGFKEVFCVATWGNEKIQSHPGVFSTEEGAKANVIKKMLIGMGEFAQKLMAYQSTVTAEDPEHSPAGQSSDQSSERGVQETADPSASSVITLEEELARINCYDESRDPESGVLSTNSEPGGILHEEPKQSNEDLCYPTDEPDPGCVGLDQSARSAPTAQGNTLSPTIDALIMNHCPVDLEPRIDMEQPVSQGYLAHVSADGTFIVQVKGPGLAKWERQTFAFDPCTPTAMIIPFRWYAAHISEGTDVDYYDRAMCISEDGPCPDERGFVQLYFPDNGYEAFVDPNMIFDLQNYEEINRVPVQGVPIHAVGLTGRTPVEELRTTHPPNHQLLFLPADRSNCYVPNCSVDVPHVYLYDMDVKRVLC